MKFIAKLKKWESVELKQKYPTSCIATGIEWLLKYHNLEYNKNEDFQKLFDLGDDNCFQNVKTNISDNINSKIEKAKIVMNNIEIKSFKTTKEGWVERLKLIENFLKKDCPCIVPMPVKGDWHIMPVIALEKEKIWMLRENFDGLQRIDILNLKNIRKFFLNEEGGEDMLWINHANL